MPLIERKEVLRETLKDPVEVVRAAASRALDRIEGLERFEDITRAATSEGKPERIRAIHFLGTLNTDDSIDKILSFLQDPEPDIRIASVKALQLHLPGRALVPLLGALEDPDASVVQVVMEALSYFRDPRVTEFLLPFLSGQDTETACIAAESLGRNGDPSSEPHLIRVLREAEDPFLRTRAAEALGNLYPGQ